MSLVLVTGSVHALATVASFFFLSFFLLLPGFAVLLVLWIVQAPSVTVHQYLPTFNTEIHCLSSIILNRVWSFVSHENAQFPFKDVSPLILDCDGMVLLGVDSQNSPV